MQVEVSFWDDDGRVLIREFLRCCGLVAAGVWDQRDLAVELVENDTTLHLEADQMRSRVAVDLYEESYRCYRLHAGEDHGTERGFDWAVTAWEALIEQVCERLLAAAEAAGVTVVEVEPVGAVAGIHLEPPGGWV